MYKTAMLTKDLVAASSKPLLLSILAGGESYGYEIIQKVRELSGGHIEWSDGMLYPVLHRLERDGLILRVRGEIRGVLEWYDRAALKIHRPDAPNILLLKDNVKYMYKENEESGDDGP